MPRSNGVRGKKRNSKKVLAGRANLLKRKEITSVKQFDERIGDDVNKVNNESACTSNSNDDVKMNEPQKATASSSKLSLFTVDNESNENQITSDYVLVHKDIWNSIFSSFTCSECGAEDLNTSLCEGMGFVSKLQVKCSDCDKILVDKYTSPRINSDASRPPFAANRQMIEAFLALGKGHAGMEQFCIAMGMKGMSTSTYNFHLLDSHADSQVFQKRVLSMAHKVVRQAHIEANPELNENDIIDISISYDGTWHKRGHTSNYGIGIVIDVLTGLVIDFQILSKYCGTCIGKEGPEFKEWLQNHQESGGCEANYTGSSNAMEAAAAVEMWKRSIELCKMRYTTIISDGDSKTHLALQKLTVYGSDTQITKDECLNHISKRLATGLRNKVKEFKSNGKVLGGKRPGSLTENVIIKLGNYYRSAIKKNIPNVEQIKSAIYSTLYHCMSTDEHPKHFKCPGGETSWCFFNRAVAKGEDPPTHEGNRKTFLLPDVVEAVIPVYQRLASNEILERCTKGKTQNANEALHSLIWKKCPKETFVSKKKIEIAVVSAVSEYNMGCEASQKIKHEVQGRNLSVVGERLSQVRDKRRLKDCARHSKSTYRTARKRLKFEKTAKEQAKRSSEGPTYGAGQF